MKEKKTFVMYDNWSTMIEALPDEMAGRMIKAICAHSRGTNQQVDDQILTAILLPIYAQMDEDAQKYKERCEKNGRIARDREAQKNNVHERARTCTNVNERISSCCDTDNDTDTDTDNDNDKKKKESAPRFTPPTVEDVEAYCQERGNHVDAQTFVDFYSAKGWKVGTASMKDWKAAVRTWEKREDRKPAEKIVVHKKENPFTAYPQRETDWAALQRQLANRR